MIVADQCRRDVLDRDLNAGDALNIAVLGQPRLEGVPGNDKPARGFREDPGQTASRQRRVQRHVRTPGLEDRQEGDRHFQATFKAHADEDVRAHTQ